ncbi:MAG: TetR/AcrR family transcriptional regulator [Gammaproteobacteria bacterium]|nr:TetR/AcrR family transcriptional regulator [Gammaproteobacteria bacterium]
MAKHAPAEVRRQQILEAALSCFGVQGYHATRMDDIGRVTGLSKGALYHHFKNKEAVFLGVFDDLNAKLWNAWQEADTLPPDDAIRSQGHLVLNSLLGIPGMIETWVEFLRHPESRSRFKEIYQLSRERLAETVQRGLDQGIFHDCDPTVLAGTLTAIIEGLILQRLADPGFKAKQTWEEGWTLIQQGITCSR